MTENYQMTAKELQHKRDRLVVAQQDLDKTLADMKAARDQGDLSENSEYDAARDHYRDLHNEIAQLSNEIENCEIVHDDKSPIIRIGSTIKVVQLNEADEVIGSEKLLTVAQHGDTIIRKTLGITSPLGKVILGKSSGTFEIVCNGKRKFKVEKVLDV